MCHVLLCPSSVDEYDVRIETTVNKIARTLSLMHQMQRKRAFSILIFEAAPYRCQYSVLQIEHRHVTMEELLLLLCLVLSAVLWGVSDALMKQSAPPPTSSSIISTFFSLISSPAYLSLMLVNQLGSVLYYFSLSLGRLSVISPVVNTGKFIVTAATGRCLGEPEPSTRKVVGLTLLLIGVILQLTA